MRERIVIAAARSVTNKQVKNAKAILNTAVKQQTRQARDAFKATEIDLRDVQRQCDFEVSKIQSNIDKLQRLLDKTKSSWEKRVERATRIRDRAAEAAGVIVQPKVARTAVPQGKKGPKVPDKHLEEEHEAKKRNNAEDAHRELKKGLKDQDADE